MGEALASTRKEGLVEAKASPTLFPSKFHTQFFQYFFPRAADAFLADFGDGLVACFVGFAFFVADFGQLHHDELALAAIFGVELHDGVGGGGGAGEEVEDYVIFFRNKYIAYPSGYHFVIFGLSKTFTPKRLSIRFDA